MARGLQVLAGALLLLHLQQTALAEESCSAGAAEATKGEQLLQVGRQAIRKKAAEEVAVPSAAVSWTADRSGLRQWRLTDTELRTMPKPRLLQQTRDSRAAASQSLGRAELTAEEQEILDHHNLARCRHGVPNMTWDADIAANAKLWADNGVWAHSPKLDTNNPTLDRSLDDGRTLGENLAASTSALYSGADAVDNWYAEIHDTDGTPEHFADTDPADSGKPIGHFTQVVWKDSTKLGCAKGSGGTVISGKTYQTYWVCQYNPVGNMQIGSSAGIDYAQTKDLWTEQVPAATDSGDCAATPAPEVAQATPAPPPPGSGPACEDTICTVPFDQCTTEGAMWAVTSGGNYLTCQQIEDGWKLCFAPGWEENMAIHCKKTCDLCPAL